MVQIIPQDIPAGARFALAFSPQVGEAFGQSYGNIAENLIKRQIQADYAKKASDLLEQAGGDMTKLAPLMQASAMLGQDFNVERLLPMLLKSSIFSDTSNQQLGLPQTREPQQLDAQNAGYQPPMQGGRQGGFFGGALGRQQLPQSSMVPSPAYEQKAPPQMGLATPPPANQVQPTQAQSQFQIDSQGGFTPSQYRQGAIVAPGETAQIQQEARERIQDPQRQIAAEKAYDDELKASFNDYFADNNIGTNDPDRDTFLNYYKQYYQDADMPLSMKRRQAENGFSQYIKARNKMSDQLQRSKVVQYTGNVPESQIQNYRNTARMMNELGDQEKLYENLNEAGLTPISAENITNPLSPRYDTMRQLPKLNMGKYKNIGMNPDAMGAYLNESDKMSNELSDYLMDNLQGNDSLLLIADRWRREHNGSLMSFNKAMNQAVANGLELSEYQQQQLTQLAENPLLNRLYETGSLMKALLGR